MLVRMMVYLTTQSALLGVQESTTELRDCGVMEGKSGAEGGPKKKRFAFEKNSTVFSYFNTTHVHVNRYVCSLW